MIWEGQENQHEHCSSMNLHQFQPRGTDYYFSHPLAEIELTALLKNDPLKNKGPI